MLLKTITVKNDLFTTIGILIMISFTKYLEQTLVFMWNSSLQDKFNFYVSEDFC